MMDDLERDDLPDPLEGKHAIEYWNWDGTRLVPASVDQLQRLREDERTRAVLARLEEWDAHRRDAAR